MIYIIYSFIFMFFKSSLSFAGDEEDIQRFQRIHTYKYRAQDCTSEDIGYYKASCSKIETGSVSGYISSATMNEDPFGRFLSKYWGTGEKLKFVGTACGRGQTAAEAKDTASYRAADLVKILTDDFETNALTGKFQPLGYVKDEERYICLLTEPTKSARDLYAPGSTSPTYTSPPSTEVAEPEPEYEPPPSQTTLVVDVQSLDEYAVQLAFFSKSRDNHEWPGGDQAYRLADSDVHNYRLQCDPGEKICYGASRSGNTRRYWGVGIDGQHGCSNCCMTCGFSYKYTLQAGDDSPSADEAVDALSTIINGFSAGVSLGNALRPAVRSSPAPVYRSPTYQGGGNSNNGSGISGPRANQN